MELRRYRTCAPSTVTSIIRNDIQSTNGYVEFFQIGTKWAFIIVETSEVVSVRSFFILLKYQSMALHIQLLSVDAIDSRPCIAVSCQNQRFLFDVGEGTQRLCVEHRVRLGRISAVMITSQDHSRYLGLPGFCLTAADSGNTGFRVVGPKIVQKFMHATRYFMRLPPGFMKYSTEGNLDFGEISIEAIGMNEAGLSGVGEASHICYVGISSRAKGKFDVKKAAALQVPRGPMYGQLKSGQPVVLPDGRVICPEQVLDEPEASRAFIVLSDFSACDACSMLQHLLTHPSISRC